MTNSSVEIDGVTFTYVVDHSGVDFSQSKEYAEFKMINDDGAEVPFRIEAEKRTAFNIVMAVNGQNPELINNKD